jgi:hypothetical protein
MNKSDHHEELLRATLHAKAGEGRDTVTFEEVRRSAGEQRRRAGRRTTLVAAAAVVVAVGAPTAFLLRPADHPPSPAPQSTGSPVPTPDHHLTAPPTPNAADLEAVRRGPDVGIPWLGQGVIHVPGAVDVPIPTDTGTWEAFTNYHGGWLLTSDSGVWQLGGDGRVQPVAQSGGGIAVSADGMRTAFLATDEVRIGITTGMGEGENAIPFRSPDPTGPFGFLSGDRVACNGLKGQVVVLDPAGRSTVVSGLYRASASTENGDLIAGTTTDDDGTAAVVSAVTGAPLWTKPGWTTGRFSPDGQYLAAYRTATGGEFETVAILDARTGKVVARNDAPGLRALPEIMAPATGTAWEDGRSLLIPYRHAGTWAILRLTADGTLSRATDVFEGNPYDDHLVFAARP